MFTFNHRYRLNVCFFLALFFCLGMTSLGFATSTLPVEVHASTTGQNTSAETLELVKPESLKSGELLIAQIVYEKGVEGKPIAVPSGWNLIVQNFADPKASANSLGQSLYYKVASNNEPTTYTWRFAQKVYALGGITRVSGASTTQPIIAFGGQSGNSISSGINQMDAPSLSCIKGSRLLSYHAIKAPAVLDIPKKMNRNYTLTRKNPGYSILSSSSVAEDTGTTGIQSSYSWNFDQSFLSIESDWIAQQIAIKPASVPTVHKPVAGTVVPSQMTVYMNNTPLVLTDHPLVDSGRTLVPMRALFEALGAEVYWDSDTRTAMGILGSIEVRIAIDSKNPTVNGVKKEIDVPARIISSRTFIPLRFVSEAFGAKVYWEPSTKTIYIQR